MLQPFRRSSVITQLATVLRQNLQAGEWLECLPGERPLSELLQVSRPTLRAALALLRREGLIEISNDRWTRSHRRPRKGKNRIEGKTVKLVSMMPRDDFSSSDVFVIGELRRHLQNAGYLLDVHVDSNYRGRNKLKSLKSLSAEGPVAGWVLHGFSLEAQRWFSRTKLPAIVMGSSHEGVNLSSIDMDYRAVCRHAVGVFAALGHRRIGLIIRTSGLAGDLASERGFLEGCKMAGYLISPVIFRHKKSISSAFQSLFQGHARPTALFVTMPEDVLALMTSLMHRGFRLPEDISLISRDDHPFLKHVRPSIAYYRHDSMDYAKRLAREVIRLATSGPLTPQQIRIMSQFQKGETLGPVKE